MLRQPALAEETVQEAFLSVWRNPGGYDAGRGSVRAWLMSTVHHRAVDEPDEWGEQPAHEQMHGRGTSIGLERFPIMKIRR